MAVGRWCCNYALAYVEYGPVALQLDDAQRAYIAQVTGGLTIASSVVDLGAMTAFMKRPVFAINAGIACDQAGTRVALRVDFDIYASPIAVDRAFFEAGPVDLLNGKDWAMLMDAEVLLQEAQPRIKQALDDMANMRTLVEPVANLGARRGHAARDGCRSADRRLPRYRVRYRHGRAPRPRRSLFCAWSRTTSSSTTGSTAG